MEKIRIKYFTDAIEKLAYIDGKSDWIDLRAAEDVTMKAGEFRLIPLGVGMKLPKGYEAHIVPRSSTASYRPTIWASLTLPTVGTMTSGTWQCMR